MWPCPDMSPYLLLDLASRTSAPSALSGIPSPNCPCSNPDTSANRLQPRAWLVAAYGADRARLQEVYRLQLRCFLGLVMEQRHLPALKLLLKLYTSISLPKLAGLMDMDESSLRSQLLLLKV